LDKVYDVFWRKQMKVEKYTNIAPKPVQVEGAKDVEMRLLISKEDGATNFVMRMFEVQPGGNTPLHSHAFEHEVFVIEGQGTVVCEGREHRLSRDYVIFVPANKEHRFKNTGSSILRFLCLIPASAA
jgi:quercetin dioxygenase-like cupin family protein